MTAVAPAARAVRLPRQLRGDCSRRWRGGRARRRRLQRLGRLEQARRLPEAFPERLVNVGIAEQAMVGIARGPRERRPPSRRLGASCFLTARGARADQGRPRLHERQRHAVRDEPRRRLRRARADPSFDRGHRLAARDRQPRPRRPRRSARDRAGAARRRRARRARVRPGQPHGRPRGVPARLPVRARSCRPARRGRRRDPGRERDDARRARSTPLCSWEGRASPRGSSRCRR